MNRKAASPRDLKVGDMVMVRIISAFGANPENRRTIKFEPQAVAKVTGAGWLHTRHSKFKIGDAFPLHEKSFVGAMSYAVIERRATAADIAEHDARERAKAKTNDDPDRHLREKAHEVLNRIGYVAALGETEAAAGAIVDAMKWAQSQ